MRRRQLPSEDESGRVVARNVRRVSTNAVLLRQVPARGLEGGAQGRVQALAAAAEAAAGKRWWCPWPAVFS